ncbi:mannosylglucosylglycerate synthase [Gottschalkiaceae bacterium SANA]|nr:mannosylglucosylglycerate synthase [Gottschalkiaceae bacterium SANA]
MRIALCHYRIGETDGVSLEMDKWKEILEEMGHEVFMIAGSSGTTEGYVIPELGYRYEEDLRIERNAYVAFNEYKNEIELMAAIEKAADRLENRFTRIFQSLGIEMVIPNNIFSIGRSLPTALALKRVIEKLKLAVICHHHDFFWERANFSKPTCKGVADLLEELYPPADQGYRHVVINHIAQESLRKRKGYDSTVVPNVFDFEGEAWCVDAYNQDFKEKLGLRPQDVIFLQATRVTNRKAIELAIDQIAVLNQERFRKDWVGKALYDGRIFQADSKIVLVLPGMIESDDGYEKRLVARAKDKGVALRWIGEWVDHSRTHTEAHKVYSLWDAYVFADFITYPSIWEGWGNQFLEGVFAKKPILIFEYAVYKSDIEAAGFETISLGDEYQIDEAGMAWVEPLRHEMVAKEILECLTNQKKYREMCDRNFAIGSRTFSHTNLRKILIQLMQE